MNSLPEFEISGDNGLKSIHPLASFINQRVVVLNPEVLTNGNPTDTVLFALRANLNTAQWRWIALGDFNRHASPVS